MAACLPAIFGAKQPVIVETLAGDSLKRYCDLGLSFYAQSDLSPQFVESRFSRAFHRLGSISGVASAIGAVLSVLHVIKPQGPEYDVSYSDPKLPFSIFVGIDLGAQVNGDLRLAESILHECMHLQLTLLDQSLPLIANSKEQYHSPWQGRMRPSQGILHGLYVFCVIHDFYRALLDGRFYEDEGESAFLHRRIAKIEEEIDGLQDFPSSKDLTASGKRLVERLLAN